MRTTLDLSEELIEQARKITGIKEKTALIHAGLEAIIRQAAYRHLAKMGGTMPDIKPIPRRRMPKK